MLFRSNTRAIINKLKQRSVDEELHIIQDIMDMSNIQIDVKNNIFNKPTEVQEWTLTMVLKELANNVIKHSSATKCDIIISEDKENYSLLFSDLEQYSYLLVSYFHQKVFLEVHLLL